VGKLIAIDGPEGCGKSEQSKRLVNWLDSIGYITTWVHEPGSTEIGEKLRHLLLHDPVHKSPLCEMLMFMASRAQLVEDIIKPVISGPKSIAVVDRFVSASLAYQSASGVPREHVLAVAKIVLGGDLEPNLWPDLTIILDVSPEVGLHRHLDRNPDLFERRGREYHQLVRQNFIHLEPLYRPGTFHIINAESSVNEVWSKVKDCVEKNILKDFVSTS
jgi:dTMP kinase